MAIEDYEIKDADVSGARVTSQPNVLRGTAQQNKQVFDNYCDVIRAKHNGLVAELSTSTSPIIDEDVLGLYETLGWTPD